MHSQQTQLRGAKALGLSQAVRDRPRCQLGVRASRSRLLACPHSMLFAPPFLFHHSLERRAHRGFCVSNKNRGFSPLPVPQWHGRPEVCSAEDTRKRHCNILGLPLAVAEGLRGFATVPFHIAPMFRTGWQGGFSAQGPWETSAPKLLRSVSLFLGPR